MLQREPRSALCGHMNINPPSQEGKKCFWDQLSPNPELPSCLMGRKFHCGDYRLPLGKRHPESKRLMGLPRKGAFLWAVYSHGPRCPAGSALRLCLRSLCHLQGLSFPGGAEPGSPSFSCSPVPLVPLPIISSFPRYLQDTPLRVR